MQTLTQLADAAFENAWQELGIHQHIIAHCKEPSEIAQWGWRAALAWQQMQSPATEQSGEAVAWQFYDQGRWHNGNDQVKDHRKNTEAAGIPTRDLYARPQPAPVVSDVIKKLIKWADTWGGEKPIISSVRNEAGDIGWWHAAKEVRAMLAAAPQPAQQLNAWFRRASMFGPWIECKSEDDGAVLFSAPQLKEGGEACA